MLAKLLRRLVSRSSVRATPVASVYALYQAGRFADAERACNSVVDAAPADLAFLRGMIAHKAGHLERAAAAFSEAVDASRDAADFHLALANVLCELGRNAEALPHFEAYFAHASSTEPGRAGALMAAGQCSMRLEDYDRAAAWFEQALALEPGSAAAAERLAIARFQQSRAADARELLLPIARRNAAARLRRTMLLPAIYRSTHEIEAVRERFSHELDGLMEGATEPLANPTAHVDVTPFYLAYHNRNNAALLAKTCDVMRRFYPAARCGPLRAVSARGRRIRVGFVSTFFHSHSVGRTTIGLIRDLPRERFEVHVFAIAPREDPIRAAIEAAADVYRALPSDLDHVRQAIESANLDALVFADVGMHPLTYFLALWRLAPVQIAYWGHSETSGIDTVDYYLSARGVEVENAQSHYTEKLVAPDAFFLAGYPRPALPEPLSRETLGLPADKRLYMSLQPLFKLHPDIDMMFARILERDGSAEIVLLESRPAWARQLRERFARTLGANAARVRFIGNVPHARFLATLAAADVALDPLYFGGCNSSCEAVALGVPVVTLPGAHLYGRFTLAIYREIGIEDCIAASVDEYVEKACSIAMDRDRRRMVGEAIRERGDRIFERKDLTLAFGEWLAERAGS